MRDREHDARRFWRIRPLRCDCRSAIAAVQRQPTTRTSFDPAVGIMKLPPRGATIRTLLRPLDLMIVSNPRLFAVSLAYVQHLLDQDAGRPDAQCRSCTNPAKDSRQLDSLISFWVLPSHISRSPAMGQALSV